LHFLYHITCTKKVVFSLCFFLCLLAGLCENYSTRFSQKNSGNVYMSQERNNVGGNPGLEQ